MTSALTTEAVSLWRARALCWVLTRREIAARYAGRRDAAEYLAGRIREGSVGVWGRTLMPRHPQITEAQALQMAQWLLALPPAEGGVLLNQ